MDTCFDTLRGGVVDRQAEVIGNSADSIKVL